MQLGFMANPACAGIVSYSSRIIAAMRAIEDEEPDKLFDDPLARVLAGDKAMKRAYQLLKVQLMVASKHEAFTICRLWLPGRRRSRTVGPGLMTRLRFALEHNHMRNLRPHLRR